MLQGAWPDPWRMSDQDHARSGLRNSCSPLPPLWVRSLHVAVEAVGWPALFVVAFSLPAHFATERGAALGAALALLIGERWRQVQRRREEQSVDALLRALEGQDVLAATDARHLSPPSVPSPPPLPLSARPRVRAPPPPRPTSVPKAPPNPPFDRAGSARTSATSQRISQRPTVPDSVRSIHVGLHAQSRSDRGAQRA